MIDTQQLVPLQLYKVGASGCCALWTVCMLSSCEHAILQFTFTLHGRVQNTIKLQCAECLLTIPQEQM